MSTTDVFGALANPVRREILEMVRMRSRTAGEIAAAFDVGRPAVSEHLQVLRLAGLVREEAKGRQRVYHMDASGLVELSDWLVPFRKYWKQRLKSLEKALDEEFP